VQALSEDADAQRLDPQALNGTNRLRLAVFAQARTGQVLLTAVFDNLGKGAAGAAVQNLELMLGLSAGPAVGATAHRRGNPAQCTVPGSIRSGLAAQRQAYLAHPVPSLAERKADLRTLQRFVRENEAALCDAISADYGHRSRHETLLAEVFPAVDGIDHVIKHLRGWMKPQRRAVDLRNFHGRAQPRHPAAAGRGGRDRAVELPAQPELRAADLHLRRRQPRDGQDERELAPPGALLIDKMPAYFPPEKLQFFDETGGVGVEFSKLQVRPPAVHRLGHHRPRGDGGGGANLCPVTLELGGKAPAIVCDDFPLQRRPSASCSSSASTPARSAPRWTTPGCRGARSTPSCSWRKAIVPARYPSLASPDYTSIIDQRSFDRLLRRWTMPASAAPRWCRCCPARPSTPPRARSRRTSCSTRRPTAR
jgi:hypothetical protein